MISTQVFFTSLGNSGVQPPITEGRRDSVWVQTRTENQAEIEEVARRKMQACYGLEIKDLELCNQFGEVE